MFVDEVKLKIKAGSGGNGCSAFRREKGVPLGGPAGGNGGKGGNVVFEVDEGLRTLLDLKYNKNVKGDNGGQGLGKSQHGANAEDTIIRVPVGTTITDMDTDLILADLVKNKQRVVISSGGRGGRGNKAFSTNNNPAPSLSENGEPGEERYVKVELKLLADVGLVGMPSVGKSTIISMVSAVKPKIAAYHFTTLSPNLGVVRTKDGRSFVMADLPGLIKGASLGEGLGDQFLKHVERTKVICHVVDMSGFEGRKPYDDYLNINKELDDFNNKLLLKPQIIIANKMDLDTSKENLKDFKKVIKDIPIYEVSAINKQGFDEVLIKLCDMVEEVEEVKIYDEVDFEEHILYKFKSEKPFYVIKEDDVFVVKGKDVEKLVKMTKFANLDASLRFAKKLQKMGIEEELLKMGAVDGDMVRILDYEFEFRI